MKQWVCVILLITLSSMHGIFEAAGSLSMPHTMASEAQLAMAQKPLDAVQCCDKQKIDVTDLVFHCPLDGKILSSGLDMNPRNCGQLHEASEPFSLADSFDQFFLRPPIA